jgi:hypothetical protein
MINLEATPIFSNSENGLILKTHTNSFNKEGL